MSNINQQVWSLLSGDISVKRDLSRKLINTRALAKYLIGKYKLKASLDSVISAIRRYTHEEGFREKDEEIINVFKEAQITTKNKVACITLRKEGYRAVPKIFQLKDPFIIDTYKVITGTEFIKVILSETNLDETIGIFQRKNIVDIQKNLSEMSVVVDIDFKRTKGVLAKVGNEIALNDINIEEMIICPPELLLYVHDKDAVKTHEIILKLGNQSN